MKIGKVQIKNRFVHSATYEAMATPAGEVTDKLIKRYQRLAKNDVGLIITSFMYISTSGRSYPYMVGLYDDLLIPGLKQLVDAVHQEEGKIFFQIAHAGRQTTKAMAGQHPFGPSDNGRDPMNMVRPRPMKEYEIEDVIKDFGRAVRRAVASGADGIQLHCAHGYLINQFLSPFFNQRQDQWGGSEKNRFRFLKEVIKESRKEMPEGMPLIVKLSTRDYTPKEGITPSMAAIYAGWLYEEGIDGVEISCGSTIYSFLNMSRGEAPVEELVSGMPWWKKPLGRMMLKRMVGKFDLVEGYNLDAAEMIKPMIDGLPLLTVGGFRRLAHMQEIVEKGTTDFISMSRPLIREPQLVRYFMEGKKEIAGCESCNKCLAAVAVNKPLRCYNKGFGKTEENED
jgi:2,4-dienoyl-CoA reductase-like NADH-dependent reductase (Old Yellow Enzyme family)